MVEVDGLIEPVEDIQRDYSHVVASRAGIGGHDDDRCFSILRQLAQELNDTYAIAIGKLKVHQNSVILGCCGERNRVGRAIREIRCESELF